MDDNPDTKTSYVHTDAGVKQVILTQADPETARRLCRADSRHRKICRDNLPIQEKTRICLGNDKAAAECDLIPMFSQRQFFALIPKNILIFPEDEVQLTHEFYSQQYKLPTEGYSVALYKAKLINTICAITRPDFLLTDQAKRLELPPYIDTSLLDAVITDFVRNSEKGRDDNSYFEITVNSSNNRENHVGLQLNYYQHELSHKLELSDFTLSIVGANLQEDFTRIKQAIDSDKYLVTLHDSIIMAASAEFLYLPTNKSINAFKLSRVLKILFDAGYYREVIFTVAGHDLGEVTRLISSDAHIEERDLEW
jgi:hypothetical protein